MARSIVYRAYDIPRRQQRDENCTRRNLRSRLAVFNCDDIDQIVEMANRNQYGLAAAVWTRDVKKAHTISWQLKGGTVWINTYGLLNAAVPFGGCKQSGFGRELGMHAIEYYAQLKMVWLNMA
jgi:aldehyde dehydrogenase (NAD+)